MRVEIELRSGPNQREAVRQVDIQENIDALWRCVDGRKTVIDDTLLLDTITILVGIQRQLPNR